MNLNLVSALNDTESSRERNKVRTLLKLSRSNFEILFE